MESTEDYVKGIFKSRNDDMAALLEAADNDGEHDGRDAMEAIDEFALSVDMHYRVDIVLGFGGPTDWIECDLIFNKGAFELDAATFRAQWGSESFSRRLSEDDALYQYAERVVELIGA